MIYKQLTYLPIIFQVDEGVINDVNKYIQRNKLYFVNVLVVSGQSYSKKFADQLTEENKWTPYILKENTFEGVNELKDYVIKYKNDLIIAIGGGKVLDTVKRVSYLTKINHLSVPTIISNDGLISPIAVIKNDIGITESLPGMMPLGVIIDINVIKESPIQFIRSAAGDILSNISATNDWILAFQAGREMINDIAFHLSKSASNSLVHYHKINLKSKKFLRLVVQGQINSGIAMSLAGTSRPCSGSEHLISHAIDYLGLANNVLHGTQVASISLFTLFIQGKLKNRHIRYAKATSIPLDFGQLLIDDSDEVILNIFNKAKTMRPGRFTVLDMIKEEDFVIKYQEFKKKYRLKL